MHHFRQNRKIYLRDVPITLKRSELAIRTIIRAAAAVSAVILAASMFSCGKTESAEYGDVRFYAMNTVVDLRLAKTDGISDQALEAISSECEDIVTAMERKISRTDETSPLYALNQAVDYMLSPDADMVSALNNAIKMYELTGGAFSPSLGTLTELWDITGENLTVPDDASIAEALSHTDLSTLTVTEGDIIKGDPLLELDLGGIGKGEAAQDILEYLATTGIPYGLVSMGGNVGVFGTKPDGEPFKIGVRDPDNAEAVVGYINISAGFIAVSGDYERYFEVDGVRYHHIFDPSTGYPADSGLRSVAVWCLNGAAADALSTALFVMGADDGLEFYKTSSVAFEAVFITDDFRLIVTDGMKNRFEAASDTYIYG